MTSIAWLDIDHVAIQGQQEFHDVITDSQSIILDMESRGWDFKIGITQDPIHRWSLPGNPYDEEWDKMMLLYAAEESSKHVKESSGALEKHLIDRMWHLPRCYNHENTGGLSPTPGRPHWCYCVFKQTQREFGNYVSIAEILRGDKVFWKGGLLRDCSKFLERVEL